MFKFSPKTFFGEYKNDTTNIVLILGFTYNISINKFFMYLISRNSQNEPN